MRSINDVVYFTAQYTYSNMRGWPGARNRALQGHRTFLERGAVRGTKDGT
jgi:hypothetical protein